MNPVYTFRLRKLQRERKRLSNFFNKKLRGVTDHDKIMELENDAQFECSMQENEIDILITEHLTSLAERLVIPVPPRANKTYWKESFTNEEFKVLTDVGVSYLRDLIREENKKRREEWNFWIELGIKFMTVLIGLAGAAICVISVWRK
jgi:hypothetical protein